MQWITEFAWWLATKAAKRGEMIVPVTAVSMLSHIGHDITVETRGRSTVLARLWFGREITVGFYCKTCSHRKIMSGSYTLLD